MNGSENTPNGPTKLNANFSENLKEKPTHSQSLLNEHVGKTSN